MRRAVSSGLLERLAADGSILPYELELGIPGEAPEGAVVLVSQERLPFVSYPYEWPFGMLLAAALLHLDVLRSALDLGYTLKDGSAYNVQFVGTQPVFVDLGSFETYVEGRPWQGFAQFCRHFLGPLLVASTIGVGHRELLRGSLDGLSPALVRRLLPLRHKLRPSVFTYVVLQDLLQSRSSSLGTTDIPASAVPKAALLRQLERLRRTISSLRSAEPASVWSAYGDDHYAPADRDAKREFVARWIGRWGARRVWDLGCNRGDYSVVAREQTASVVAIDGDGRAVDALYERVRGDRELLPLVIDLLNPSPSQGWAQRERIGLVERERPDALMALALVHHLRIGGNVPAAEIVRWLAELSDHAIVEYVPPTDPKVVRLLALRSDVYDDYVRARWEQALRSEFEIEDRFTLPGSGRVLFALRRSAR